MEGEGWGGEGWAGPQERSNFQGVNDRRSSSQLHIMGGLGWVGGPNYQVYSCPAWISLFPA